MWSEEPRLRRVEEVFDLAYDPVAADVTPNAFLASISRMGNQLSFRCFLRSSRSPGRSFGRIVRCQ
jgi:hypothetical protein